MIEILVWTQKCIDLQVRSVDTFECVRPNLKGFIEKFVLTSNFFCLKKFILLFTQNVKIIMT